MKAKYFYVALFGLSTLLGTTGCEDRLNIPKHGNMGSQEDFYKTDADAMQIHFTSMLSYIQKHDEILSMMGQLGNHPEGYQNMIDYVKKNGLKIHGFAISTKKKTLLELYKEDVVSYIQTTPQN